MPTNNNVSLHCPPHAHKKVDLTSSQRYFGYYTTDELAEYGIGIFNLVDTKDCKAAIDITPDMLIPYVGMKVVGMRFGVCCSIDKSRVFITPLNGNNFEDDAVSVDVASTVKGWNTVMFNEPYTIPANKEIYAGFDFVQKTTKSGENYTQDCYPLSAVSSGLSDKDLILFADIPASKKGHGKDWYNFGTDYGNLSVQLIIEGNFPDYAAIASDFTTFTSVAGLPNSANIDFFNSGVDAITSIDYVVSVDGVASAAQHVELASAVAKDSYGTFVACIPAISEFGLHNIAVDIAKVNGNENEAQNRVSNGKIGIPSKMFPLNVVIEEFTTEYCSNCPRVAGFLHTALKKADQSRVFAVCHHAGFGTDWLTGTWDNDILRLIFGYTGSSFAPAVTYNRDKYYVEKDLQRLGLATTPPSANNITATINEALSKTSNAKIESIEIVPSVDETNATVTIKGICNEAFDKDNANLTFYLTEDSIKARKQSGASGTYYQMHVIRANNSSWGEKVNWVDNSFTYTCDVTIDAAWEKKQMKAVAFLNNYNLNVYADNKIINSLAVDYNTATTSNSNAIMDNVNVRERACYTLYGTKVSAPVKGLNIVKMNNGRIVKIMVK